MALHGSAKITTDEYIMRAELHMGNLAHIFVWGEGSDVEHGLIRVSSYDFDEHVSLQRCKDFPTGTTQKFWANLVTVGFRRNMIPYHKRPSPLAR